MKFRLTLSVVSAAICITIFLSSCSTNLFAGAKLGYLHKVKANTQPETEMTKQHKTKIATANKENQPLAEVTDTLSNEHTTASLDIKPDPYLNMDTAEHEKMDASAKTKEHTSDTIVNNQKNSITPPMRKEGRFDGYAIAGFVCGLVGLLLVVEEGAALIIGALGIIFSIIALIHIKKTGKKGKGLAKAGIIAGAAMFLLVVIAVLVSTSYYLRII